MPWGDNFMAKIDKKKHPKVNYSRLKRRKLGGNS